MVHRRMIYGGILLAALLFVVFNHSFLAPFCLALTLAAPVVGLLLSLPAILGCRVWVEPERSAVERGGEARWLIRVERGSKLPLARLTLRLTMENALTGVRETYKVKVSGVGWGEQLARSADTTHCGKLVCGIQKARACDCLGLFTLGVKVLEPGSMLVCPVKADLGPLAALGDPGRGENPQRPRPGGGPGEDYDLRDYRPGDPMRAVHWKRSAKQEDLVVRETLEPVQSALVLVFDHFGPAETVDRVLDRVNTLSRLLLTRQRAHFIQWREPVTGQVRCFHVTEEREFGSFLSAALGDPAPERGASILDKPQDPAGVEGTVRRVPITLGEEAGA